MIQKQSKVQSSDNSGMRLGKCIHIYGGYKRNYGFVGDNILLSIKTLRLVRKVKRGELHKALIIRTRKKTRIFDGISSKFKKNSVILLSKQLKVLSSRVFGPFSRSLRKKKIIRLLLLSNQSFF